jgi:hypothetical protein
MPSLLSPSEEWGLIRTLPPWGTLPPLPLRGTPAGPGRTVPHGGAVSDFMLLLVISPSARHSPAQQPTRRQFLLTNGYCCTGYWLPGHYKCNPDYES